MSSPPVMPANVLVAASAECRHDERVLDVIEQLLEANEVVSDGNEPDQCPPRDPDGPTVLRVAAARNRRELRALATCSVPALVLGPRCRPWRPSPSGPVIVCLDGSIRSTAPLDIARPLAELLDGDVWLITASPPVRSMGEDVIRSLEQHDIIEGSVLARIAARLPSRGAVNWEVVHGAPVKALLGHASIAGAAIVALNTHGHVTPSGVPVGRIPTQLVLRSEVPVLLTFRRSPPPPRRRRSRTRRRRNRSVTTGVERAGRPEPPTHQPPPHTGQRRTRAARALRHLGVAGGIAAATLGVALGATELSGPFERVQGATLPAAELVMVRGRTDASHQSILVTYVHNEALGTPRALWAWVTADDDLRPRRSPARGASDASRLLMTDSTQDARAAALTQTGLDAGDVAVHADHRLGGPSAGLAIALELIDATTPGDLTLGQVVAVTGTIDPGGSIESVGGIRHKARAAERAGADLFLVPEDNAWEARAAAPGMRIVPVATLTEALAALGHPR